MADLSRRWDGGPTEQTPTSPSSADDAVGDVDSAVCHFTTPEGAGNETETEEDDNCHGVPVSRSSSHTQQCRFARDNSLLRCLCEHSNFSFVKDAQNVFQNAAMDLLGGKNKSHCWSEHFVCKPKCGVVCGDSLLCENFTNSFSFCFCRSDPHRETRKVFIYHRIAAYSRYVFDYVVSPAGLITNTISFFVMNMKHNQKHTTCLYMSILAVSDNLLLLRRIIFLIVSQHFPFTGWTCKIEIMCHHMFAAFGAYTIFFMTWDKFYAVVFPHKVRSSSTRGSACVRTAVNLVCVVLFYCPLVFTAGLVPDFPDVPCSRYVVHGLWYVDAYAVVSVLFYPVLPVASLFVMNCGIIRAIYRSRSFHSSSCASGGRSQETQVVTMLLLVSFLFIALTLPLELWDLVVEHGAGGRDAVTSARVHLGFWIVFQMALSNSVVNFYLYLLSGTKFRRDLRTLLGRAKPQDANIRVSWVSGPNSAPHVSAPIRGQEINSSI